MESRDRFFQAPKQSFFLLGPRGTGKTLWTQRTYPGALRVDLLEPDVHRELAARPERLRALIEGSPRVRTVVIDEVQKVPELLSVAHALLEERRRLTLVFTGSSARKLRRGGVDLLAGRAVMRSLHPFMAGELDGFDLEAALRLGMVPLVRFSKAPSDVLRSYVSLYVREEVQLEGLVRNVGSFARFLEAICFSHGAVLNVANVARECQVERKTVDGYLEVLEDLLLAFRVPVFGRRAKRELAVHSKFYFFDPGVFRSLRLAGPLDRPTEIDGGALEGLVAERHPPREMLAALYRVVRAKVDRSGAATWPDDTLTAALQSVGIAPKTAGIGLDMLAEAGVIQREYDGDRWRISLGGSDRKDLATSLRFAEGRREAEALDALKIFAFGPLTEILQAVAGPGAMRRGSEETTDSRP